MCVCVCVSSVCKTGVFCISRFQQFVCVGQVFVSCLLINVRQVFVLIWSFSNSVDMFVSDMSGHMFACQACLSMSDRQWVQRDAKDGEMLFGDTLYEITTAHRCCNVCHSCKRNVYFCDETLNAFDGKRLLLHFIQHLWEELFDMNFPFLDNCFHG